MSEEREVFIHVEPPINGEKMFGPFSLELARREADRLTWELKKMAG